MEKQVQLRSAHISRSRSNIQIAICQSRIEEGRALVVSSGGVTRTLDLLSWCGYDAFDRISKTLLAWAPEREDIDVDVKPMLARPGQACLALPSLPPLRPKLAGPVPLALEDGIPGMPGPEPSAIEDDRDTDRAEMPVALLADPEDYNAVMSSGARALGMAMVKIKAWQNVVRSEACLALVM